MNNNNKYVFIVDSSMTSANRIFSALGEMAFILKVDHATNGKDALKKIKSNPPNAILFDLQLPGEEGVEIMKQIKEKHPNIILIVLTDYPTAYSHKICKKLGANGFYNKTSELEMALKQLGGYYKKVA
ncbi:MAG TPA: response regulator [Bacteroidia bacterium]